jgi:hypothetical protein
MISFKSNKVRQQAKKAFIAIFKMNLKANANRNIIYTLNKLMLDGNRLKKYYLASLSADAAA